MKNFLIFIASLSQVLSQTANCVGMNSATCATNSGYCYWTGSACQLAECHKVTDVRACRSSTSGYLATQSKCKEITTVDPNFLNQCMENDQTTMMYAYARFPTDITQLYSTKTTSGYLVTTIMTAKYTSQYKYEILTVNILTASSAELLNIMNAYVQMQYDLVDPEIHPQYLEKAIYESMQAIRDDVTLTFSSTPNKKQDYYTVLWRMTDAYFLKLRSYQPFYISNKYLINFGFAHFNRITITLTSQLQSTQITWTTYADNGYLELLVIPAEQFGILGSLSDIIIIRPSKLDGSDASLSFTIRWLWSYDGTQPQSSANLYSLDKIEMNSFSSVMTAGCVTGSKYCQTGTITQSTTKAYMIGASSFPSQVSTSRYYSRCRLGRFTWTGSSNSCA